MSTQAERIEKQLGAAPDFRLTDVQASWLACAIDGEGSIGIHRPYDGQRGKYRYRAVVSVTNTNLAFLAQVKSLVDGNVHVKTLPKRAGHKVCFAVDIKARAIPNLLEQIQPYLVIKQQQAKLVLQFCRAVAYGPVHNGDDHEIFEQLYLECKALNRRGG